MVNIYWLSGVFLVSYSILIFGTLLVAPVEITAGIEKWIELPLCVISAILGCWIILNNEAF